MLMTILLLALAIHGGLFLGIVLYSTYKMPRASYSDYRKTAFLSDIFRELA